MSRSGPETQGRFFEGGAGGIVWCCACWVEQGFAVWLPIGDPLTCGIAGWALAIRSLVQ